MNNERYYLNEEQLHAVQQADRIAAANAYAAASRDADYWRRLYWAEQEKHLKLRLRVETLLDFLEETFEPADARDAAALEDVKQLLGVR